MNFLSFFYPQTLGRFHSSVNNDIKVVERFGKKILYVQDIEQTGGTITKMWEEAVGKIRNLTPVGQQTKHKIRNCLVLGVGGGEVIGMIKNIWPDIHVLGIEIDRVIIQIAKKYFYLDKYKDVEIVVDDGVKWIKENKSKKFDLVIVDLYIGKYNPKSVRQVSFFKDLKKLLGKSSLVLFNSHFSKERKKEFEKFYHECKKIFSAVDVIIKYKYSRILALY